MWGVDGAIVNYQARPDTPRIDPERGREIKYETVAGSTIRLDVPPPCRPRIGSTHSALWVTEGVKKADALATAGACAIGLLGVDCFKTDDWDRVSLDGRDVYVANDSDVMVNPSVCTRRWTGYGSTWARRAPARDSCTSRRRSGRSELTITWRTATAIRGSLYTLAEAELRPPPPEEKPKRTPALPTAQLLNVIERLFC